MSVESRTAGAVVPSRMLRADAVAAIYPKLAQDEVIVVIDGEIVLGRRGYGPGTAIAIARDTLYGFRSGDQGLVFINFRPRSPVYVPADKSRAAIDERAFNLARMPVPEPVTFASPMRETMAE